MAGGWGWDGRGMVWGWLGRLRDFERSIEADGLAVGVVELEDFGPKAGAGFLVGGAMDVDVVSGWVALLEFGFELVDALIEEAAELGEVGKGGGGLEEVGNFGEGG